MEIRSWHIQLLRYVILGLWGICLSCIDCQVLQNWNVESYQHWNRSCLYNNDGCLGHCIHELSAMVRLFQIEVQKILTSFLFLCIFFSLEITDCLYHLLYQSRNNPSSCSLRLLCGWKYFPCCKPTLCPWTLEKTYDEHSVSCCNLFTLCWSQPQLSRLGDQPAHTFRNYCHSFCSANCRSNSCCLWTQGVLESKRRKGRGW